MKLIFVSIVAISACLAAAAAPAIADEANATKDAQSVYSAGEVGVARRNFRGQCLRYQPAEQCECYTAGFAQALSVPEMRLATALLPARFGKTDAIKTRAMTAAAHNARGMGIGGEAARMVAMTHIDLIEKDLAKTCIKVGPGPQPES